jgi:hypothetical protein
MCKVFHSLTKTRGLADQKSEWFEKICNKSEIEIYHKKSGFLVLVRFCRIQILTSSLNSNPCQVFLNNWTVHHTKMTVTSKHWNSYKELNAWFINKCSPVVSLFLNVCEKVSFVDAFLKSWWKPLLSQIQIFFVSQFWLSYSSIQETKLFLHYGAHISSEFFTSYIHIHFM